MLFKFRLPLSLAQDRILSIFRSTFDASPGVVFNYHTVPGLGLANVITPTSRRGLTDRAGRMPALFLRIQGPAPGWQQ